MKKIFLILISILLAYASHSQAYYSLNSVQSNQIYTGFEAQQTIHFKLYNALGIKKNYNWIRSDECTLPTGWHALVCDCDNCYTVNEYSNVSPGYVIDSCNLTLTYQFDFGADLGFHTTKLSFSDPINMGMQAVSIYLTINNGCSPTGLNNLNNNKPISIYPIPTSNFITIDGLMENEIESVSVYNVVGLLVLEDKLNTTSSLTLDLSKEANGIYFLKLKTKEANVFSTYKIEKK